MLYAIIFNVIIEVVYNFDWIYIIYRSVSSDTSVKVYGQLIQKRDDWKFTRGL